MAAESALPQPLEALVRSPLEPIAALVQTTAETVRDGAAARRAPPNTRTDIGAI